MSTAIVPVGVKRSDGRNEEVDSDDEMTYCAKLASVRAMHTFARVARIGR